MIHSHYCSRQWTWISIACYSEDRNRYCHYDWCDDKKTIQNRPRKKPERQGYYNSNFDVCNIYICVILRVKKCCKLSLLVRKILCVTCSTGFNFKNGIFIQEARVWEVDGDVKRIMRWEDKSCPKMETRPSSNVQITVTDLSHLSIEEEFCCLMSLFIGGYIWLMAQSMKLTFTPNNLVMSFTA